MIPARPPPFPTSPPQKPEPATTNQRTTQSARERDRRSHEPGRHERTGLDEERLARLAAADRGAFSALYEAHVDRIYRYLLARTSNPAEAEELTSRVFLNALSRLDQYRGRGAGFGAWLMSIAHNLLVNWYRDRGRRPPTADLDEALELPSSIPGPESSLERNERITRVRQAVSSLAPDRQQLIALKYVECVSNAEIGRIMGRTEGAIKALHHRTLRELQSLLDDQRVLEDEVGGRTRR